MSNKKSPFDYVKSINFKTYEYDLSGYNPFLTNRAFAEHIDTIMLSEQMNQCHKLGPELQYDFYYFSVRKGKRFGFPPKPPEVEHLDIVIDYFGYSKQKALEALQLLSHSDINNMRKTMDKGGRS